MAERLSGAGTTSWDVNSQFDDAKIDWVCEVDGTQSANDLEAQRFRHLPDCKYAPPTSGQDRDQQGGQCQSCLVSEQPADRDASGSAGIQWCVDPNCGLRLHEEDI
eukprot:1092892-Rhodomonas_salina.1